MNLYIWKNVEALRRYAPGTVIVAAFDPASAIELGANDYRRRLGESAFYAGTGGELEADEKQEIENKVEIYRHELAGMNAIVHNYPVAINLEGGE